MKNILFVCTGNSCRSVMAEGIFRKLTLQRKNAFEAGSAGVGAFEGCGPTLETVHVMAAEGMDVSRHCGRRLTPELVRAADKILVMELRHRHAVLSLCPEASGKVELLRAYSREGQTSVSDAEIPDPIGTNEDSYRDCLKVIKHCVEELIKKI